MKNHFRMLRVFALLTCLAMSAVYSGAQSPLLTTFAGGNGQSGNMFDVKSLTGVLITDFDINIATGGNFEVWALNTPGTYLGNQSSNTNWTLLATVTGLTANGAGVATPMGLNLNFAIPPGVMQAFYITSTGTQILSYTNGTAVGNLYASNTDLEFYEGHGGTYFNLTFNPRVWNGNIHYLPLSTVTDDMQMSKIIAPVNDTLDCSLRSSTEVVTVEVRNLGMNLVPIGTFLTLTFQVDGGATTAEFLNLTADLMQGGTLQYTFTATADLSAAGNHTLDCGVIYAADLDPTNDNLIVNIGSGGQLRVTNYPYSEDFTLTGNEGSTTPPLGFVQETTDATGTNSDWIMRSGPTPTITTGPSADHTTGVAGMGGYAHIDDDSNHATINLRSPCFDLSGLALPNLRFFMYSDNGSGPTTSNLLSVDVISHPSGTVTTDVFGPQGQTGPAWMIQVVDLSAFTGQIIQLVFRGETATNPGNAHDIAIDDVSVGDLLPTPGQAAQAGLAVLDINDPRNINGDPLSFGFGGPYFTTVTQGDTLTFKMQGEALQPIVLFSGPLNPAAASFPGIGSVDVGGAIDPMTGLPTLITVLADGTTIGGFNPFFVTAASGTADIGFTIPNLPIGVLGTFQCALLTSGGAGIALTNAVQVSVQ